MSLTSLHHSKRSKCRYHHCSINSSTMHCWNTVHLWNRCCCNSGRM